MGPRLKLPHADIGHITNEGAVLLVDRNAHGNKAGRTGIAKLGEGCSSMMPKSRHVFSDDIMLYHIGIDHDVFGWIPSKDIVI